MLSIVIPTYNEGENVKKISEYISRVMKNISYEIIFIDDSTDDTEVILEELKLMDSHVRYEHRYKERSLSTAVVRGFELSSGDTITVMDADLQHPPEMLVSMLEKITLGADLVIPSRFILGGSDGGLNLFRKIISTTAKVIGKAALKSLRPISDPTGGFFMFQKKIIEGVVLEPIGWKILIEILARCRYNYIVEIPYKFQPRIIGKSKMSINEQKNYLIHLFKLMVQNPEDRKGVMFTLVGLISIFINMIIFIILVKINIKIGQAGIISAFAAMISNLLWRDIREDSIRKRFLRYFMTSLVGLIINSLVIIILYYRLNINYLLSNTIGILCNVSWNYLINKVWPWQTNDLKTIVLVERNF